MIRQPAGFTLVEMVVAVILGALVMLGLAAVFGTVLRFQTTGARRDIVQAGGLISLRSITKDLQASTAITSPSSPCPGGNCSGSATAAGDVLTGCTNWEMNSGQLLDPSTPMRTYHYCVQGDILWYHWREDPSPLPCPPPPFLFCGTPITGWELARLADGVEYDVGQPNYFKRPAGMNNVVEVHYVVQSSTSPTSHMGESARMVVNVSLAVQKSLTSPDP